MLNSTYNNYADSYIVKPLGFGEFSETVRELSSYWLIQNRPPPERYVCGSRYRGNRKAPSCAECTHP